MTEETLFEQAVQLPIAERIAFLNRECPDPVLRARVEALLAADAASHSPLDGPIESTRLFGGDAATRTIGNPAATGSYRPAPIAEEAEGVVIARRYKLRQQIGEGGMGTVWMADQTEPVKRKVAVKLIRVDKGQSRTILARFEAERQAIALMDHPHIAKLLDAGTTETGSPFFIMELVKGVPLNEFCDTQKLTIPERLNLFTQICSAVQHAHQKGIIHRDLKPSNILVESHDGKAIPKVIDFGLAKATTGLQLTEQSMFTGFGTVMGTPLYMAPEQANFNAIDVDTRADVYALGVILYELLTGSTPITRESFKKAALDEMLRLVREQEAPTPSSRLSSCDNAPSVAANRQIEPTKLGRFVKGELDWIVLKALSKDRDRRYETANGFARDIERFLNHEPVQAGPPTARYRLRKFVQRNKGQVIAASLVFAALVAGVIGTSIGLAEAKKQEQAAREAERNESLQRIAAEAERDEKEKARKQAVLEKERADRERAIAEAVKSFVVNDIFDRAGDQRLGKSAEIKAKTLLEEAAKTVGEKFKDQPEVELEVRNAIASGFGTVGDNTAQKLQLTRVLELCRKHRPKDDDRTLEVLGMLAIRFVDQKEIAIPYARESFEGVLRKYGATHTKTLSRLASYLWVRGSEASIAESLALCEKYLAISRNVHGEEATVTLGLLTRQGTMLARSGKLEEGLAILREVRSRWLKIDPTSRTVPQEGTWHVIAGILLEHGQNDPAIPLIIDDISRLSSILGADHAEVTYRRTNLANCYFAKGDFAKAGPAYLDVLEGDWRTYETTTAWSREAQRRAIVSLSRSSRLDLALARAEAWANSDKPDQLANAVSLLISVIQITTDKTQVEKLKTRAMQFLQRAVDRGWQATHRLTEFEALSHREDFAALVAKIGKDRPSLLTSLVIATADRQRWERKYPEAIKHYQEAIRLQEVEVAKFPDDDTLRESLGIYIESLGITYHSNNQPNLAISSHQSAYRVRKALYERATSDRKREYGNQAAWSLHNEAIVHRAEKRFEKAAQLYTAAVSEREKLLIGRPVLDIIRVHVGRDWDGLGVTWEEAGRLTDAETAFRKALTIREAIVDANFDDSARRGDLDWSRRQLARVIMNLGKFPEACDIYRKNLDLYRKTNEAGTHDALALFGMSLLKTSDWVEAEAILKECVDRRQKQIPDAWQTFNAYSSLGGALLGQKKYADAEPLLLNGYEGMNARETTITPEGHTRIPEALDRLIELYTATKKPDEVKKYRELRAKYPTPKAVAPMPREKK